jgi:hypothetical protein
MLCATLVGLVENNGRALNLFIVRRVAQSREYFRVFFIEIVEYLSRALAHFVRVCVAAVDVFQ